MFLMSPFVLSLVLSTRSGSTPGTTAGGFAGLQQAADAARPVQEPMYRGDDAGRARTAASPVPRPTRYDHDRRATQKETHG